jgi:hypothetical protein
MKSALVVIFNQDFSRVIPKLEMLYADRFSKTLYLVPDHASRFNEWYWHSRMPQNLVKFTDIVWNRARRIMGKTNQHELRGHISPELRSRMCRVIGYQFYFYDYIIQAAEWLLSQPFEWLWFMGDDVLLRPGYDEAALARRFSLSVDTDAVICKAETPAAEWISYYHGSVAHYNDRMASVMKSPSIGSDRAFDLRTLGEIHGVMTCCDFFGMRREFLATVLPLWRRCFQKRIFVETAVPTVFMSCSNRISFIDHFFWYFGNSRKNWGDLMNELMDSEEAVFTHPVKLSEVPLSEMHLLRKGPQRSSPN